MDRHVSAAATPVALQALSSERIATARATSSLAASKPRRGPRPVAFSESDAEQLVDGGENRVIVITSGKGGVGKTTSSANLGMSIARCACAMNTVQSRAGQLRSGLAAFGCQLDFARRAVPRSPHTNHPTHTHATYTAVWDTRSHLWMQILACATWTSCWAWRTGCCTLRLTSWRASAGACVCAQHRTAMATRTVLLFMPLLGMAHQPSLLTVSPHPAGF